MVARIAQKPKERQPTKKELRARQLAADRQRTWDEDQRRQRELTRQRADFAAAKEWAELCERYESERPLPGWVSAPRVLAMEQMIADLSSIADAATLAKMRAAQWEVKRDCAAASLRDAIADMVAQIHADEQGVTYDLTLINRGFDSPEDYQAAYLAAPHLTEERAKALRELLRVYHTDPNEKPVNPFERFCRPDDPALVTFRTKVRHWITAQDSEPWHRELRGDVLQENLARVIKAVLPAVASRPALAVLGNVFMTNQDTPGSLDIWGTNLELGIRAHVKCRPDMAYVCTTVPAKTFADYVDLADPTTIQFLQWQGDLTIMQQGHSATFKTIQASEFPGLPDAPEITYRVLDTAAFAGAIKALANHASKEDHRPILTGIKVEYQPAPARFELVSSSGYKFLRRSVEIDSDSDTPLTMIIPARTLAVLAKLLTDKANADQVLEIAKVAEHEQVYFKLGNVEIFSLLIDGPYPAVESLTPAKYVSSITLDLDPLLAAVKGARTGQRRDTYGYKPTVTLKTQWGARLNGPVADLTVSGKVENGEVSESTLVVAIDGLALDVDLNSKMLYDTLSEMAKSAPKTEKERIGKKTVTRRLERKVTIALATDNRTVSIRFNDNLAVMYAVERVSRTA